MALHATHIRFALACANKAGTELASSERFLAGSIYPDSRYFTKMPRESTHMIPTHMPADFQRGVETHLLFDQKSTSFFEKLFPDLPVIQQGNETWQMWTAAKIINDMYSAKQLHDAGADVFSIDYSLAVNVQEEPKELLEKYYASIASFYSSAPTLVRYRELIAEFSIPENISDGIFSSVETIQNSEHYSSQIASMFKTHLESFTQFSV